MNFLQDFLAAANAQTRPILQEAFTFVGATAPAPIFYGTFGDPQIMPIMTRTGYEDHLVRELKAEAVQWTGALPTALPLPLGKSSILRTQTGATLFVQAVDTKDPVIFTFILTDREL